MSLQNIQCHEVPRGLVRELSFLFDEVVVCVCYSGEGTVYHLDEMTGALVISHTLVISSKDYPGMMSIHYTVVCVALMSRVHYMDCLQF